MRILFVDQNQNAMHRLTQELGRHGFACDVLASGLSQTVGSLDDHVQVADYDAIVLGDTVNIQAHISAIRDRKITIGLIAMIQQRNLQTMVSLLSAGADDVLVHPVHPQELAARLQSVVRRTLGHATSKVVVGDMTIYFDGRDPEIGSTRIKLSAREHSILTALALRAGKVVPKQVIYNKVYHMADNEPFDKVIDVYICKLRKKISAATGGENYIETVWGRGYKLHDTSENVQIAPKVDKAA